MKLRIFLLLVLIALPLPLRAAERIAPLTIPVQQQVPVAEEMEIEAPVPLPERDAMLLPAGGAAGLLLIGAVLLVLFLRKKSQKPLTVLQPHETALLQLAAAHQLIAEKKSVAFAALLDHILRSYIEERFGIAASKHTASELIRLLTEDKEQLPELLKAHSENVEHWLRHCDVLKFAGASLSQTHMTELIENLRNFIETTKEAAK